MKSGAMVTYKELSLKLDGYCGIVEGSLPDNPNIVWVRWVGETYQKTENIGDLEEI